MQREVSIVIKYPVAGLGGLYAAPPLAQIKLKVKSAALGGAGHRHLRYVVPLPELPEAIANLQVFAAGPRILLQAPGTAPQE